MFDHQTDSELDVPTELAAPTAVLLFDGIFLHRPELRPFWDFSVFLEAPFEVTVARCALRDGGSPDVNAAVNRRYVGGQQLYLEECKPARSATMVINHADLMSPEIVR